MKEPHVFSLMFSVLMVIKLKVFLFVRFAAVAELPGRPVGAPRGLDGAIYQDVGRAMRALFIACVPEQELSSEDREKTLQLYLCHEHQCPQVREEIKGFGCKTLNYKRTSRQMWPEEQAFMNLGAGARPSQPEEMENFHLRRVLLHMYITLFTLYPHCVLSVVTP